MAGQIKPIKLVNGVFTQVNTSTDDLTMASFSGNGANLTNLNASNLASGTISDGLLSANVAILNSTQTFTHKTLDGDANTLSMKTNAGSPSGSITGIEGELIYDTTNDILYVCNGGTSWQAVGGGTSITEVVAGAGLTGGGTSGTVTLDIGQGAGINVGASDISLSTTSSMTMTGDWNFNGGTFGVPSGANDPVSGMTEADIFYNTNEDKFKVYTGAAWENISGDITAVIAGAGLTGGGSSGDVTLDVNAGLGIKLDSDLVAVDTAANLTWTGSHNFSQVITAATAPTGANHLTNKTYVDNLVSGLSWKAPVLEIVASLPGSGQTLGDRYLLNATANVNKIAEWNGTSWDYTGPVANWAVLDSSTDAGYTYDAQAVPTFKWIQFTGAGQINAGIGLWKDGNTLNVNLGAGIVELPGDEVGIDLSAVSGLELTSTASGGQLQIADTLAGNGLDISNKVMTLDLTSSGGLELSGTSPNKTLQVATTIGGLGLSYTSGVMNLDVADTGIFQTALTNTDSKVPLSSAVYNFVMGTDKTQLVQSFTAAPGGITQYDAVTLDIFNRATKTDCDDIATSRILGIALETIGAGNPVKVAVNGLVPSMGYTWNVTEPVFLSSTAGELTQYAPSSGYLAEVGIAVSGDTLLIQPKTLLAL